MWYRLWVTQNWTSVAARFVTTTILRAQKTLKRLNVMLTTQRGLRWLARPARTGRIPATRRVGAVVACNLAGAAHEAGASGAESSLQSVFHRSALPVPGEA